MQTRNPERSEESQSNILCFQIVSYLIFIIGEQVIWTC